MNEDGHTLNRIVSHIYVVMCFLVSGKLCTLLVDGSRK